TVKLSAWSQWVLSSLRRDLPAAFSSLFGVAVGVGGLVFFVALGVGVGEGVRGESFSREARVVGGIPSAIALGSFFGGGQLDASTVERLSALPQVEAVFPKMNIRVPVASRYNGDFFGARLNVGLELAVVGVDPKLLEPELASTRFVDL